MSATESTSDVDTSINTGVTFSNETDVEQAKIKDKTPSEIRAAKDRQSLSQSAKKWDLDGDGELDDAEMALRQMDKSHKGTLSKEQMYELMSENLKAQRDLFKVKKMVIGLVVFTCILALSNLGTAFAAAFIAKDTTTTDDKLVDKKTGNTIATDTTKTTITVDPTFDEEHKRRRKLACTVTSTGNGANTNTEHTADCAIAAHSFNAVSIEVGEKIAELCYGGHTVSVQRVFTHNGVDREVDHPVCPLTTDETGGFSNFVGNGINRRPKEMNKSGGSQPFKAELNLDATAYELTALTSPLEQFCTDHADCTQPANCDSDTGLCVLAIEPSEKCSLQKDATQCVDGFDCTSYSAPAAGDSVPVLSASCNSTADCANPYGDVLVCSSETDDAATPGVVENGVCSRCDFNDVSTYCTNPARPACVDEYDNGYLICGCAVDGDCPSGQTCGSPSCIGGGTKYCSVEHDFDAGCNICVAQEIVYEPVVVSAP